MPTTAKELLREIVTNSSALARQNPEIGTNFVEGFVGNALKDGALTVREKELVALGMAIRSQCDYCIALHVKKALDAGVTPAEVGEVCEVAVVMGGGPAMMFAAKAMAFVEELSK